MHIPIDCRLRNLVQSDSFKPLNHVRRYLSQINISAEKGYNL